MLCVGVDQFGQVVQVAQDSCQYVLIESTDYLASASLNPEDIALSFAWGFGSVVSLWSLAFAIKAALKAVKLL